jgi:hypothetical protein
MVILDVTVPTSIVVDSSLLYAYFGAFLVLAGVLWGVRQLIRLIKRS